MLEELFVQSLGVLSADGLITLQRVMQDGTKIRANAAADSFRKQERVEQALKASHESKWRRWERMSEEETSRRVTKARQRAARERQERLEQALKEFNKLGEEGKDKEKQTGDQRVIPRPG